MLFIDLAFPAPVQPTLRSTAWICRKQSKQRQPLNRSRSPCNVASSSFTAPQAQGSLSFTPQ